MKTKYQSLYDTMKIILRGNFINTYTKKKLRKTQINKLIVHFRALDKQEQAKYKISRKKLTKIRTEIN